MAAVCRRPSDFTVAYDNGSISASIATRTLLAQVSWMLPTISFGQLRLGRSSPQAKGRLHSPPG